MRNFLINKNLCLYYRLKKKIGKKWALGVANTIEKTILIFGREEIPYSNRKGWSPKNRNKEPRPCLPAGRHRAGLSGVILVNPVRNSSRSDSKPSGALNPVRDLSLSGINPTLRGGAPYGAEPGIILKSNPAAAAGPEGRRPRLRPRGASAPEGWPLARREQRGIISNGVNWGPSWMGKDISIRTVWIDIEGKAICWSNRKIFQRER